MSNNLVQALSTLTPNAKYNIINNTLVWLDIDIPEPSQELIDNEIVNILYMKRQDEQRERLVSLSDKFTQLAENYVAGKIVSSKQLIRFNEKFDTATTYKSNGTLGELLSLEANLRNISIDEQADRIITAHNVYKESLKCYLNKIEAVRVTITPLIVNGEFDKVDAVFEKILLLDYDVTDEDIINLFN